MFEWLVVWYPTECEWEPNNVSIESLNDATSKINLNIASFSVYNYESSGIGNILIWLFDTELVGRDDFVFHDQVQRK